MEFCDGLARADHEERSSPGDGASLPAFYHTATVVTRGCQEGAENVSSGWERVDSGDTTDGDGFERTLLVISYWVTNGGRKRQRATIKPAVCPTCRQRDLLGDQRSRAAKQFAVFVRKYRELGIMVGPELP